LTGLDLSQQHCLSVPLFGKEGLGEILLNKSPFFKGGGERLFLICWQESNCSISKITRLFIQLSPYLISDFLTEFRQQTTLRSDIGLIISSISPSGLATLE
jgi:hypothetical protein